VDPHADVILQVFVIFVAAKAAAEVFVRLGLPAIAGELMIGVLLGPHVAGVIEVNQATATLAELGIVILLFTVGLETPVSGLMQVGRSALLTSIVGMVAAAATAFFVMASFGSTVREGLLVGTALAASSVGIAARVFHDLGLAASPQARVVVGASVVDDVVVLALFPFVFGLGAHGTSWGSALIGLAGIAAFVLLVIGPASRITRRHPSLLGRPRVSRAPFVLALIICLGLAALAEQVGLAALVGAFVAGMVLAESRERYELDRRMLPLFDFLVPFFFVVAGAQMDPRALGSGNLGLAGVLVAVTVLAKLGGCALGAGGLSLLARFQVGAGMVPRNEVALVVAAAGLSDGAVSPDVFSVVVAAVIGTTLLGPLILRLFVRSTDRSPRPEGAGPLEAPRGEEGRDTS
jgi:Na+:H+ antiporter